MSFVAESEVEELVLEWLSELGYSVLYGPSIGPGEPGAERESWEVVLTGRLRAAVGRLNPGLPAAALDEAVARFERPESQSLVSENWRYWQLLVEGLPVEYRDADGELRHGRVRLVDFDDPAGNDWLAVNQFTVKQGEWTRRPDVVTFCNGVPVGVFELKNPGDENATLRGAFNQLQTYKEQIPQVFHANAVLVVADGLSARAGSLTAGFDHFAPWKTIDGVEVIGEDALQLETLTRGMFAPVVFCELLRFGTSFNDDRHGLVKKLAKYHQFWAVRKAVERTVEARSGDGRAGVVWHTQGSGKSLEMLLYAGQVMRHPAMENPTLVVLCDRNDLDDQLFDEVFATARSLPETPVQATSREHLRELLSGRAAGGIVFTTLQKFAPPEKGGEYPRLTDRRNVVVIADEAHRSQYDFIDGFARHLRDGLPNATFIGFTGTPIESDDRSTRAVFGEYIDVYDLTQAVEDGATVRIYYEARLAKLSLPEDVQEELDAGFEELTEGEEEDTAAKAKTRWSRLEAIVGAPDRLGLLARDLVEHWETRREAMPGKAMAVCMSRQVCVRLYDEIAALRPEWVSDDDGEGRVKVVITGSASDDEELRRHVRSKDGLRTIKDRAKNPADPLELVIVRDMWLTGFDSPSMHTMYVDKPMKGHSLMQAIARVNRTFADKPGGLVVDYIGIAENLRAALANYTDRSRNETGIPVDSLVKVVEEKHEVISTLLHDLDWSAARADTAAERLGAVPPAMNFVLGDEDRKDRYLSHTLAMSKAFALCATDARVQHLRRDLAFFLTVRAGITKLTSDATGRDARSSVELDAAVAQLVSDAVAADGVVDIYSEIGLERPDISILSEEFLQSALDAPHKNVQMEMLRRLLNDEIRSVARRNLVESRQFSEMLSATMLRYQNRSIDSAKVIAELVELARRMQEARQRGEDLGLSEGELAFYDAIVQNDAAVLELGDDTLKLIAHELVATVKANATIDWDRKESVRAKLRAAVRRLLLQHRYPPDRCDAATQLVIEQAELFAREVA
jgi:type I restriction enzyme R subunit